MQGICGVLQFLRQRRGGVVVCHHVDIDIRALSSPTLYVLLNAASPLETGITACFLMVFLLCWGCPKVIRIHYGMNASCFRVLRTFAPGVIVTQSLWTQKILRACGALPVAVKFCANASAQRPGLAPLSIHHRQMRLIGSLHPFRTRITALMPSKPGPASQTMARLKCFKCIAIRCEKNAQTYADFVAFACGLILMTSVHTIQGRCRRPCCASRFPGSSHNSSFVFDDAENAFA